MVVATTFLSYDDELVLSDALHARAQVLDAHHLRLGQELPADAEPAQREAVAAGNRAGEALVAAYSPLCLSLAYGALRSRRGRGNAIDVEDLHQIGLMTMLKATMRYDARGASRTDPQARRGRRFAQYSRLYVLKEINRHLHAASAGVSLNTDVVRATWCWLETRDRLAVELGRQPRPEEIEAASGIARDYVELNLPTRVGMVDIDTTDVADASCLEESVAALVDAETFNGMLEKALHEVFQHTSVEVFMTSLGVDIGVPRSVAQTATHLGMTRTLVASVLEDMHDYLRHPAYRSRVASHLARLSTGAGVALSD